MGEKKNEMKFTILFSSANPDHVFAANKLNSQSRNNKANYVAQAIRFHEDNSVLNRSVIEKAVMDILSKNNASMQVPSAEKDVTEELDEILKEKINSSLQIFKRCN